MTVKDTIRRIETGRDIIFIALVIAAIALIGYLGIKIYDGIKAGLSLVDSGIAAIRPVNPFKTLTPEEADAANQTMATQAGQTTEAQTSFEQVMYGAPAGKVYDSSRDNRSWWEKLYKPIPDSAFVYPSQVIGSSSTGAPF